MIQNKQPMPIGDNMHPLLNSVTPSQQQWNFWNFTSLQKLLSIYVPYVKKKKAASPNWRLNFKQIYGQQRTCEALQMPLGSHFYMYIHTLL